MRAPATLPPPAGAARAPLGEDVRRAVTALLRERAHHLPSQLPPRAAAAARLAPVLLHVSIDQRPFDDDPPGVAGLKYRRRWSSLARAFRLPPPNRAQRGRCLVDAVLAVPLAGELEILAVVAPGVGQGDLRELQLRLDGLQRVLSGDGVALRAGVLDPARAEEADETWHRALAFGALVAGRLSPSAWWLLEGARGALPTLTTSALAARAPTAFATLALTLLTRGACPAPLDAALALLAEGHGPRALADAETFCARWAGLSPGLLPVLEDALALARAAPGARALGDVVQQGRALAVACARAIRASGLGRADRYTQRLWRETLGPGMPRLLLPALAAGLAAEAEAGRLRLEPIRVGRVFEVQLPDGGLLGRGSSPVQARVRALGLVAAAAATQGGPRAEALQALLASLEGTWRELVHRLARPRERPRLVLLLVAGRGARPGPPLDLLNRGPDRALEFDGAVATLLLPGRRPSAQLLSARGAVEAVLQRAPDGAALEVLAAQSAAHPIAARLARIAALLRDPSATPPVAVEAGGLVYLVDSGRARVHPIGRFAARPRVYTPDPDAPDISMSSGKRQGLRSASSRVVQCRVTPVSASLAAILYSDDAGTFLREEVPLGELEARLRDAREIVRAAHPPAVLAVRLSEELEQSVRRARPAAARLEVAVRGALPFVQAAIGEERFGGAGCPLGWRDAAEALLARFPPGLEAELAVNDVTVTAHRSPAGALLSLYASAVVRRRLGTHLHRAMAAYRNLTAGRREG